MPALLLAGERDEFCPSEDLRAFGDRFRTARVEILADTDHYLWRHERAAASLIGEFVDGVLAGTASG